MGPECGANPKIVSSGLFGRKGFSIRCFCSDQIGLCYFERLPARMEDRLGAMR